MDEEKLVLNESGNQTDPPEPEEEKTVTEQPKDEVQEKKYSDADLDAILSKKFAKWTAQKEKELTEAQKLAEMNAQQKAEYERDKLQKELEALKRENTLNAMGKTARGMLAAKGVNLSDELVSMLITEEAESTKRNVDAFVDLFNTAVETAVTEELKSSTPKRMADRKPRTREEILNIPDDVERRKAIQDNLELFN